MEQACNPAAPCAPAQCSQAWGTAPLAALAFLLTLGTALIGLPLQDYRIAIFWPAAGVITGLVLGAPGRKRLAMLLGACAALAVGNALQRRGLAASLVFIAGNLGQALLLTAVLECVHGHPVQLDTLPRVGSFLLVTGLAAAVTGLLTAAGLRATGHASGAYWQVWHVWFTAHAIGILTVAPALLACNAPGPATRAVLPPPREGGLLLALVLATAFTLIGLLPADHDLALMATFAVLSPLLLWIAARQPPAWSSGVLGGLAVVVVWQTARGAGLFAGHVAVAQLFLVVMAMWTLTLGALLEQQRRAVARARASDQRVRAALAVGQTFAFEWAPRTQRVVQTNAQQVLGPDSPDTAPAYFARIHPDDRTAYVALVTTLSPQRPSYTTTYRYQRQDGRLIWLAEQAEGEFDSHGNLTCLRGLAADVTARTQAEAALRESEARYRALTEAVPSMPFEGDAAGGNTFASEAWCRYTGLTPEATAGLGWTRAVHPEDLPASQARWAAAMAAGIPCEMRHRLRAADGTYRWFLVRALPLRDGQGTITRWVGSCTDIEDLVQAEAVLRDLNATLEQRVEERSAALEAATAAQRRLEREAQRAEHFSLLGRLAAGVSHELRNPLGAVFLNIDLLAEELAQPSPDSAAEVAESLAAIRSNLARVEDLMEDYLSLARVGALERTVQDLGAALQAWAAEFQALAASQGMTLRAEGLADLGAAACHANTLRRAVLNLVQNGLEAMAPGGTLTLRGQPTADAIVLEVADTGGGIPAERLPQIFEPLHTTKPGGTGLGLYIVQEVVHAHGGQVTVESAVGQGTTFTLTLPRLAAVPS
ncbi:MAG: PAS domain-containing protein [Candidatus Tectimicrobiota bacterium]